MRAHCAATMHATCSHNACYVQPPRMLREVTMHAMCSHNACYVQPQRMLRAATLHATCSSVQQQPPAGLSFKGFTLL